MALTDEDLMPFGKHKGIAMANVPGKYLLWLEKEGCFHSGVKQYIDENIDVLRNEA